MSPATNTATAVATSAPAPVKFDIFSESRYRGGVRIARLYGGQGTVTVFLVRSKTGGRTMRIEAFGATPGLRKTCAQHCARIELAIASGLDRYSDTIQAMYTEMRKTGGSAHLARYQG